MHSFVVWIIDSRRHGSFVIRGVKIHVGKSTFVSLFWVVVDLNKCHKEINRQRCLLMWLNIFLCKKLRFCYRIYKTLFILITSYLVTEKLSNRDFWRFVLPFMFQRCLSNFSHKFLLRRMDSQFPLMSNSGLSSLVYICIA